MFGELLESRQKRVRQRGGAIVSAIAHGGFVALAILATGADVRATADPGEREFRIEVPRPVDAPVRRSAPSVPSTPTRTSSPVVPSQVIPDIVFADVPIIDALEPVRTEIVWGSDASRHTGPRFVGPVGGDSLGGIPFASGVEKPAIGLPGNPPPKYPDILRNAGVGGAVTVQVVVTAAGVADMATLKILRSDHALLSASVAGALPKYRFLAAETGGRKVPMWVEMTFVFQVNR